MPTLAHHLLAQARNNRWANHRLLAACGKLSAADFAAPRVGFFPSIRATLNHNLTVDWYYVDAIERSLAGAAPNPRARAVFDLPEPCADCATLAAEQVAVDQRLIAVCTGLDAAQLAATIEVQRAQRIDHEPLHRLLAHLFQHQVHHRGQAHAMLSGTPVAPPQLDEFFCADDADRRIDDFAALGWTEAALWPAGEA